MHVQAIGAAVDLRRAHPDEVEQLVIEAGLMNLPFKAEHGLKTPGFTCMRSIRDFMMSFTSTHQDGSK